MKHRSICLKSLLMCVSIIIAAIMPLTADAAGDMLSGGWRNPLGPDGGDLSIISGGTFNNDSYYTTYSQAHGGVDMYYNTGSARAEEPVYSIGDGVVDYIRKVSDSTNNDSVIHIRYTAADGTSFKATYGHTYAVSGLAVGDTVTRGQQIGNTTHWNSYHLHFAVVWNRQKTPSGWGGLNSDLLGSSTSTAARLELLHEYGWWEPFEFLAAHPSAEMYNRDPFFGAVVVPGQAEFYERPDVSAGTGDYANRSDVLSIFASVTDTDGNLWYALAREGGYYINADDVDVIMSFQAEPVRLLPIDDSVGSDSLSARVGDVLYVYPSMDDSVTGGAYSLDSVYAASDDADIAAFASTAGGRLDIMGTGEAKITFSCRIGTPDGQSVPWYYSVPLTVNGSADVDNTVTYEVVYSSGLRIRELPTTSSTTVIVMPSGSLFTADMDRTADADGYTWAYVTAETGETGWTAISNSSYCTPVTGYTLVQAGTGKDNHRYLVYKGEATWAEAKSYVDSLGDGWHLATITSAEEQAIVSRLVSAYGGTCWLGGQYSSGWSWVTGEDFSSYTNWDDSEPSGNSSEPYLGIYGNSTQTSYATDGKWNDFKSSTTTVNGFVAEKDAIRTITFSHEAELTYIGEPAYVNALVAPALAEGETLSYTVADPSILSVSENGEITGISAGVTDVTVRDQDGNSGTIRVYIFDQMPIKMDALDLRISVGGSSTIPVQWNDDAPMRQYLSSYEIVDAYTDGDLITCDGMTISGSREGIAFLHCDIVYTTVDGELLYGDSLYTPVVVGDIFTPEREHYECAVGDTVRIFYELTGDFNENDLRLYWESTTPDMVSVDQEGYFTVLDTGYPAIEVFATWAKIPVGYIDLSFLTYDTAVLPDGLTVLEKDALRGINVWRIDARGTGLQRIESGAMADIPNLRSVCLDADVTYIAPDAFDGSTLTWIHCPEGSYAHQWALDNGYSPNVW